MDIRAIMAIIAISIIVSVGWSLSATVSADTFIDDFEDEGQSEENWTALNAEWQIEDGKCIFSCPTDNSAPGALLLDLLTEDKMEIEVSVKDYGTGVWQNFYIVFAYLEDENEMYRAGGFVGGGEWRIHFVSAGSINQLQVIGAALQANQWYDMKIAIDGDTVVFYADGKEEVQYTFPEGMPVGRIGFGQSQAAGEFDNFRVKAPGIDLAVAESAEKLTTTWAHIKSK